MIRLLFVPVLFLFWGVHATSSVKFNCEYDQKPSGIVRIQADSGNKNLIVHYEGKKYRLEQTKEIVELDKIGEVARFQLTENHSRSFSLCLFENNCGSAAANIIIEHRGSSRGSGAVLNQYKVHTCFDSRSRA